MKEVQERPTTVTSEFRFNGSRLVIETHFDLNCDSCMVFAEATAVCHQTLCQSCGPASYIGIMLGDHSADMVCDTPGRGLRAVVKGSVFRVIGHRGRKNTVQEQLLMP